MEHSVISLKNRLHIHYQPEVAVILSDHQVLFRHLLYNRGLLDILLAEYPWKYRN